MVQNGKNACEMVEIDQVEEERSTYVGLQVFFEGF